MILRLDETILTETPPRYHRSGRMGEHVRLPITGNHARRVVHGMLKIHHGHVLLLIPEEGGQETHHAFLRMISGHGRGGHIVVFEDRGAPPTADESRELARALGSAVRFLPTAAPEHNAMDHLWRHVQGQARANRTPQSIDESADRVCQALLAMRRRERLRNAGVLSGTFGLTT